MPDHPSPRHDHAPEQELTAAVDQYLLDTLVNEDESLAAARAHSTAAGLREIAVSPAVGKFLSLICRIKGARRVLEFGTLGGYSTLWFAQAVGEEGTVVTLELEESHAAVARENFATAGLSERIELLVGPAAESAQSLITEQVEPFDVIFIDADKPNNPRYIAQAISLSKPGTVIIIDNVIRQGQILDPETEDERVIGAQRALQEIGRNSMLSGTALQLVGAGAWDGFALAVVS